MIIPITIEAVAMSNPDEKNALTIEVAQLILSDSRYRPDDWSKLAVVYNFLDGRKNSYGYVYFPNGEWEARAPDENWRASLEKMLLLQSLMERETGKKWMKALVHIDRDDESLDIKFEYDDPDKWIVNPGDLDASAAALKPS